MIPKWTIFVSILMEESQFQSARGLKQFILKNVTRSTKEPQKTWYRVIWKCWEAGGQWKYLCWENITQQFDKFPKWGCWECHKEVCQRMPADGWPPTPTHCPVPLHLLPSWLQASSTCNGIHGNQSWSPAWEEWKCTPHYKKVDSVWCRSRAHIPPFT